MAQAELAVFEVDAETLSAFMLKEWGMPALHDAISAGEQRSDAEEVQRDKLRLMFEVAGVIARILIGPEVYRDQLATFTRVTSQLGVEAEQLPELLAAIVADWHEVGTSLKIQTREVPPLAETYRLAVDGGC